MRQACTLVWARVLAFLFLISAAVPAQAEGPRALDEGAFVTINGQQQWVTIRGSDIRNPVLLLLHGGPGFAMSFLAPLYRDWEKEFTLVQWDQPASGGTNLKNLADPGPLTIARYVRDGIAVSEWARKRLGVRKLVLLGTSWGSLIGVEMAMRRPDLFAAYVGAAQAVGSEGNLVGYHMALDAARTRGDAAAIAALENVGPPPYQRFEDLQVRQTWSNPPALPPTPSQAAATAALVDIMMHPDPKARYNAPLPPPPGYDGGFMAAQRATWRQTWSWEARRLGSRFRIPVFIFQGEADLNTPTPVARKWFDEIKAPRKAFEIVPGAGHDIILFQRELLGLLERHVLSIARAAAPAAGRR